MTAGWNCKYMAEAQGISERRHNYFVNKQCNFLLKKKSKDAKIQKYIFKRPKYL